MQSGKHLKVLFLVTISIVLASCASTSLRPIGVEGKPFVMEEDEQQVWRNAKELDRLLDKSEFVYKDPKLEAYLNEVAQKLFKQNAHDEAPTPRIKVIKHPLLNAFALPHGVIYVHTGMLARMENEAQLAAVLGHELTHFTHRHAVKEMRQAQNKLAFARALQVMLVFAGTAFAGGQAGSVLGDLTGQVGALWTLASVRGYSREMETEADTQGLGAMVQAGYDPVEAPKVFEHLQQELDEQKVKEPFFFGTHPRLQERIENYQRLIATEYAPQAKEPGRVVNTERYLNHIEQLLLDNAALDVEIGRFRTAQAAIEKHLTQNPESARAYFLMGEVHRRGGQTESDSQRAIAAYQEAVRLDPTYAEPHRELGLFYRAQNRWEEARAHFRRYLTLNSEAVDAPIIRLYLADLDEP